MDPAGPRLNHPPDGARLVAGADTDADHGAVVFGGHSEASQFFRRVGDGPFEHERLHAVGRSAERVEVIRLRNDDANANGAVLVAHEARLVGDGEHALEVGLIGQRRRG